MCSEGVHIRLSNASRRIDKQWMAEYGMKCLCFQGYMRGFSKPMGVSEYELTRALPEELKSSLPTIEEIEAELEKGGKDN